MFLGYARISSKDQNLDLQLDALKKAGCELLFKDIISGAKTNRPALDKMLEQARKGDIIVVWKLDRLGRSLKHLVELIALLIDKGIGFKSLNDNIDTTTSQGRLIFNIFASLAEFERDLISERTKAGLQAARSRGRVGGRPKGLSENAKLKAIVCETLYKEGQLSISQICTQLNLSKNTFYSYLKSRNVSIKKLI
jgi:DNA invertase Pin-like site-specific DNA recombinase